MKLKFHSSILITNDIERLKNFYVNILNQEIELDFGACITLKCGLSIWQLSKDHTIAKHLGRQFDSNGNKNLELCFETETFDNSVEEIIKHSPKILHDVSEETWGQKTLRFYDPDNNIIEIGETIPCFVKRMYAEGMSIEEIAGKTSVPLNLVEKYNETI